MAQKIRLPLLNDFYNQYLIDHDANALGNRVLQKYGIGTLERLASEGKRMTRRAAVLALGLVADYESNAVLGRAMVDEDRGVRTIAENGIRALWCRDGSPKQQRHLHRVIQLNAAQRFDDAIRQATLLIAESPALAESWNQRAVAYFSTGRYRESICDCEQALELNPYHFGAASGMGQCHLQLNDRAMALECFRRALGLNPGLEGVRAHVLYLQRTIKSEETGQE